MSYELAKKLKNAGYPQGQDDVFAGRYLVPNIGTGIVVDTEQLAYNPTLSELIEACALQPYFTLEYRDTAYWSACIMREHPERAYAAGHGATPEEAVANLWLKLHEVR